MACLFGEHARVDAEAVLKVARRLIVSKPTFATLGQVGRVEPYGKLLERLA